MRIPRRVKKWVKYHPNPRYERLIVKWITKHPIEFSRLENYSAYKDYKAR